MARTLTKDIRNKLAVDLAALAVGRHSAAMGRLAKLVKRDHAEVYETRLRALEPGITMERWAELIQKRLVSGKPQGDCLYYSFMKTEEGKEPKVETGTIYSNTVEAFSNHKSFNERHALFYCFTKAMRNQAGFGEALGLFGTHELERRSGGYLKLKDLGRPSLPYVTSTSTLDHTNPAEAKLTKDYQAITARLHRIISEGWDYLNQCLELLNACKNEKQLIDLFPEAAKMLPQEVRNTQAMVPVELATKVRKMLETGVPTE